MKIIMKDGYNVTEEIEKIAKAYNFYTDYINNYSQMLSAKEKNSEIMKELSELGVEKLKEN